ncbi:ATP-binding protein [Luedemannella helvata]|uniref:ATP-binding protein n=1 Tax=Luedemannella helvata TaxID=349315 RepID=UPI0031D58CF4
MSSLRYGGNDGDGDSIVTAATGEPGDLRAEVLQTEPVTVLRMSGRLRRGDGPRASRWIVDALADSPDGLVVDLGDLVADPGAGESLHPVATQAKAWPGRIVAMCRRPDSLRPPQVPIFPTVEAAIEHVRAATPAPRRWQELERSPAASADARRMVTQACAEWRLDGVLPAAQLVVTELVNNAVLHASGRFLVVATLTDHGLHVSVRDSSRQLPRMRRVEDVGPDGGQGLTLVNAFATEWGATPLAEGKVVWADLRE